MINVNLLPHGRKININQLQKLPDFAAKKILSWKSLDKKSEACIFFGADNKQNIMQKFENQINLILLKSKEAGILPSFLKRTYISIDKPNTIINAWNQIWTGEKFEKLNKNPARFTFEGKFFGENGLEGYHTIGLLYEPRSKILFCLDSLSNLCKQVYEYQEILKKRIFNSPRGEIKKIIFSNKPQQYIDEYTCNNWAIANIERLQKALKENKKIDTTEKLNNILPDDINNILQEQYEYVLKHKKQN